MSQPIRVQLSRKKGWRMPPNTIRVARPCLWGNPFRVGFRVEEPVGEILEYVTIEDAAHAVTLFEQWLRRSLKDHAEVTRAALALLRGKNLACWCALGKPCHADVLLRYANEGPTS
jgi:hypothetical protein